MRDKRVFILLHYQFSKILNYLKYQAKKKKLLSEDWIGIFFDNKLASIKNALKTQTATRKRSGMNWTSTCI